MNGVLLTSMRCRITASLRAKATLAFFLPVRAARRTTLHQHGQDDMRRFVENRAHAAIANLRDPPAHVLLARLVAFRCHPEIANRLKLIPPILTMLLASKSSPGC